MLEKYGPFEILSFAWEFYWKITTNKNIRITCVHHQTPFEILKGLPYIVSNPVAFVCLGFGKINMTFVHVYPV